MRFALKSSSQANLSVLSIEPRNSGARRVLAAVLIPMATRAQRSAMPSHGTRRSPHRDREVPMGILDDLLGGLAGQTRAQQQQTQAPGGGGGMSQVLMALMPVVLQMMSNRGAGGGAGTGGGLADVLGQVLGGGGRGSAGGARGPPRPLPRGGLNGGGGPLGGRGGHKPVSPGPVAPGLRGGGLGPNLPPA